MHYALRLVGQDDQPKGKLGPGVLSAAGAPDAVLRRLFVTDRHTGRRFLVDTGADVSVIPAPPRFRHSPPSLTLSAANGTPIPTHGQRLVHLDLGLRRVFQWLFLLAEVNKPILGTDFLSHFNLLVDIRGKRLVDGSLLTLKCQPA